jgi:hypothetical protein
MPGFLLSVLHLAVFFLDILFYTSTMKRDKATLKEMDRSVLRPEMHEDFILVTEDCGEFCFNSATQSSERSQRIYT